MTHRFAQAVVTGRRDLTSRISEFTLGLASGKPLPPARAGTHAEIRFGGADGTFLRHYSLVGRLDTRTEAEPFWRIAVQREPRARGSDFIHRNFRPGHPLWLSRPLSPFHIATTDRTVLLVAGGIGITAMLPMLRSCRMRGVDVRMIYAGRSRPEMAYVAEALALGGDAVTILAEDTHGRPHFDALLAGLPDDVSVYTCGPAPMMAALESAATRRGLPPQSVHREIFNAAHHPEDQGFTVRTRSGREVPVPAGMTILDALEGARIDTLSDCRRGECGLCITALTRPAPLDHRDQFLTGAEKAQMDQIAICCSRPVGQVLELDI